MTKKDFFKEQGSGTEVKIKFYQDYLEIYLIKVLMQFGQCLVADLFCGPGKSGSAKGSPLVLLDQAKRVLQNPLLRQRYSSPKIFIFFNDIDPKHIASLKSELSKVADIPNNIIVLDPENKSFSEVISDIEILRDVKIPKFFFLDPFSYSKIKPSDVGQLMRLPFSEVLLFLPTFHAYRFCKARKKMPNKLKEFLENFTVQGIYDYKNIYEFVGSIKERLSIDLKLDLVKPILIDVGKTKNTLIFLTRHIKGMFLVNKIFLGKSYNGLSLNVSEIKKNQVCPGLFPKSQLETKTFKQRILDFQYKLINELKVKKKMTNTEMIRFIAAEGFLPKYANKILRELKKMDKIKVVYFTKEMKRGFYIAEDNWDKELCVIQNKGL